MASVVCPKCGFASNGVAYCPQCGNDLSALVGQSQGAYPPPPQAYPQAPAAAYPPAPGYGSAYGMPVAQKTNTLAIIALIASFVASLVGLICGIIALSQIKRTGEAGRGMALAAVIISSIAMALGVLLIVVLIAAGAFTASVSTY